MMPSRCFSNKSDTTLASYSCLKIRIPQPDEGTRLSSMEEKLTVTYCPRELLRTDNNTHWYRYIAIPG